ncbi:MULTISPECIES: sensor histidine kinase [Chitinophagaceae]
MKHLSPLCFSVLLMLLAQIAMAQINDDFYAILPDSIKPIDKNNLSFKEDTAIIQFGLANYWNKKVIPLSDTFVYNFLERSAKSKNILQILSGNALIVNYLNDSQYTSDTVNNYKTELILKIADKSDSLCREDTALYEYKYLSLLYKAKALINAANQYEEAADILQQCWVYYLRRNDLENLLDVCRGFGALYSRLRLFKEAVRWDKLSIQYLGKEYSDFISSELVAVAAIYLRLYMTNSSDKTTLNSAYHYINVIQSFNSKNKDDIYSLLALKAFYQYLKNDYKQARLLIDSSLANPKPSYRGLYVQAMMVYKAYIYYKTANADENIKWLQQVIKKDYGTNIYFYNFLYLAYVKKRDWEKAYLYFTKYKELEDSQNIAINRGKVFEVNQRYRVKEQQATIDQLEQRNKFNQLKFRYGIITGLLFFIIILAVFFLYYRNRKLKEARAEAEHRSKMEQMQKILLEQEIQVQESRDNIISERKNIGRILHDGLSNNLATLRFLVEDYKNKAASDKEQKRLSDIEAEINALYEETRSYSHDLTKDAIGKPQNEGYDIVSYLQSLREKFGDLGVLNIHFNEEDCAWNKITPYQARNIFFIIKECLTNIVKHAYAKNTWISLSSDGRQYSLNIKDDGKGIDNTFTDGIGVTNLRTSIGNLNGCMKIDHPEKGVAFLFTFS